MYSIGVPVFRVCSLCVPCVFHMRAMRVTCALHVHAMCIPWGCLVYSYICHVYSICRPCLSEVCAIRMFAIDVCHMSAPCKPDTYHVHATRQLKPHARCRCPTTHCVAADTRGITITRNMIRDTHKEPGIPIRNDSLIVHLFAIA